MATVSAEVTLLDDAEATTDWVQVGSGPGLGSESDFVYQNTKSVSIKGSTAAKGVALSDSSTTNISGTGTYQTVLLKVIVTSPGLLELITSGTPPAMVRIGSSSSAYYQYLIAGSDTWPLTTSWQLLAIDPNVAAHRERTSGSPSLTTASYYAWVCDQTGTSRAENIAMDAVYVGAGMTLTGTAGTWQDFITKDQGTAANRYGMVTTIQGAILVVGNMIIGNSTATTFSDSDKTIIFPVGRYNAGFTKISCGLSNASTVISFLRNSFIGNSRAQRAGFESSSAGINGSTEVITTQNAHGFETGDIATYSKQGGSASTGGVSGDLYGITKLSSTTLAIHHGDSNGLFLEAYGDTSRVNLTAAGNERHTLTRAVDMRPQFVASGTSGTLSLSNCNFQNFAVITLTSSCSQTSGAVTGSEGITQGGATLTGIVFTTATTEPGEALIAASDPAAISDCDFTSETYEAYVKGGHAIRVTTSGTYSFSGNTFTGYGPARRTFDTTANVNGSTEIITCDAAHGYSSGDAVYYSDEGGAVSVGLTDGNLYYVNAQSTTTLSFHLLPDDAIDDLNKVNLTASGSETHAIYSANAAIWNDSGGTVTLNIQGGGDTPTVRNTSGLSTVVNNTVTVQVTTLDATSKAAIQDARILLEADTGGDLAEGTDILTGVTDSSGLLQDTGFNYTNPQPVRGWARKSSASIYYKEATIAGSIGSGGLAITLQMIRDE